MCVEPLSHPSQAHDKLVVSQAERCTNMIDIEELRQIQAQK